MSLEPEDSLNAGINLVLPAFQSPDYVAGVSGWAVFIDGSCEFNNGTFRGTIVVTNTGEELLVYQGTPAAGNLLVAIAAVAGADSFGNAFVRGITVANNGVLTRLESSGAFLQFGAITGPPISLSFNPSPTNFDHDGVFQVYSQTTHGAQIFLATPYDVASGGARASLTMTGFDGTTASNIDLVASTLTLEGTTRVTAAVVATDPVSSPAAETWHDMTLASAQWSNASGSFYHCSYRLLPNGDVEIRGTPIFTGNGSTGLADPTTLATLPSAYWPSNLGGPVTLVPTGGTVTLTANRIPHIRISTAGVVQVFGITSPATNGVTANLFFQGTYSR